MKIYTITIKIPAQIGMVNGPVPEELPYPCRIWAEPCRVPSVEDAGPFHYLIIAVRDGP